MTYTKWDLSLVKVFYKAVDDRDAELIALLMKLAKEDNEEIAKVLAWYLMLYKAMAEKQKSHQPKES